MDDILGLNVYEMQGIRFNCSCGREHAIDIKKIEIGKGVIQKLPDIALEFKQGKIFLMADNNTYPVGGRIARVFLEENGFDVDEFIFNTFKPLVPDENAIGRLIVEIEKNTSLIVSAGSGSLNDLAKIVSYKMNIPYIIIGTAPSMDGYASTVSALIIEGYKKTLKAVFPYAIIADTDMMKTAPDEMIRAGFGDIIGKFTALADWELSKKLNREYYCETSVKLVKGIIKKCMDNAKGLIAHDAEAILYLAEALVLSGVAMGVVGNSRPASGSEHHLAHYWEMDALAKGEEHPLHGNSVGVGTVVISSIYEITGVAKRIGIEVPKPGEIEEILKKAGAYYDPVSLGISKELFHRSILHAMEVRPRYTVLQYANKLGLLDQCADILTERFYG